MVSLYANDYKSYDTFVNKKGREASVRISLVLDWSDTNPPLAIEK